ncbi:MAG: hypothetical protein F6J92_41235 [Symploca sp. SIO1A3]|nr:hypothetical protein [Symploca sp. SIO1A3]
MMARDLFHKTVKNGLIKEGWQITDDPFFVKVGGVEFFIDIGAEKLIAAEKDDERIAVEIKSFINPSSISDRKKQGYKPPNLSVEKTKILSLFQAPGFRHGVNLKSKI